jgi:hypothetical protein
LGLHLGAVATDLFANEVVVLAVPIRFEQSEDERLASAKPPAEVWSADVSELIALTMFTHYFTVNLQTSLEFATLYFQNFHYFSPTLIFTSTKFLYITPLNFTVLIPQSLKNWLSSCASIGKYCLEKFTASCCDDIVSVKESRYIITPPSMASDASEPSYAYLESCV